MSTSAMEQLFESCRLDIITPDTSIDLPSQNDGDQWLEACRAESVLRKQAFFDEQLQFFLMVYLDKPVSRSEGKSTLPPELVQLLLHLQIVLDGTYISPVPAQDADSVHLSMPPRMDSLGKLRPRSTHPSIYPPHTPNPSPSTTEKDRRYIQSEGTLLISSVWGQSTAEDSKDAVRVLWSETKNAWVVVYRLALTVAFLRLQVADPLLCLTVSVTLRDKDVTMKRPRHPLTAFLASVDSISQAADASPLPHTVPAANEDEDFVIDGLEEVNLLEGLSSGPIFSSEGPNPIFLPSTRLGSQLRHELFSLAPVPVESPGPMSTLTPSSRTATLRKSFRKTLQTVSGFRVRMRTVFVPFVLLPESGGEVSDAEDERERREAGSEERTVILCVEIENSGEGGADVGFLVEHVEIVVGGEGSTVTFIGWGEGGFDKDAVKHVFPIHVRSMEQYNLLYAVGFLRSPSDAEALSLASGAINTEQSQSTDLQRAVTINISGKPYLYNLEDHGQQRPSSYPAHTFSSRWNCVLDLSSPQRRPTSNDFANREVLPEPPSPFPMPNVHGTPPGIVSTRPGESQPQVVAGAKRHTVPGNMLVDRFKRYSTLPVNYRASTSMLNPANNSSVSSPTTKFSYTPPSITVQSQLPSSTTFAAPAGSAAAAGNLNSANAIPPPTPAYPSYPANSQMPPTPISHAPIASQTGNVGPSIDIRRQRSPAVGASPIPQTPGPLVGASQHSDGLFLAKLQEIATAEKREPIVVSVGILPPPRKAQSDQAVSTYGWIFPLDEFTLDIFVFNKSSLTRRFEISFPDRRMRHKHAESERQNAHVADSGPGILPLDNRVRVGPLRPSTCQSVRMDFLALRPGVHSIEILTLTDIETGLSMNLRSVMDVVVHDPVR